MAHPSCRGWSTDLLRTGSSTPFDLHRSLRVAQDDKGKKTAAGSCGPQERERSLMLTNKGMAGFPSGLWPHLISGLQPSGLLGLAPRPTSSPTSKLVWTRFRPRLVYCAPSARSAQNDDRYRALPCVQDDEPRRKAKANAEIPSLRPRMTTNTRKCGDSSPFGCAQSSE
jgi:hypothetical protein